MDGRHVRVFARRGRSGEWRLLLPRHRDLIAARVRSGQRAVAGGYLLKGIPRRVRKVRTGRRQEVRAGPHHHLMRIRRVHRRLARASGRLPTARSCGILRGHRTARQARR